MRKKEYKVAEQRRAYDLSERFLKFAALIIEIIKKLPANLAGRRIGDQLFRAGTSTGANYEEACGAESKKGFIHKLGITLKELRETYYWLKLIRITKILPDSLRM